MVENARACSCRGTCQVDETSGKARDKYPELWDPPGGSFARRIVWDVCICIRALHQEATVYV